MGLIDVDFSQSEIDQYLWALADTPSRIASASRIIPPAGLFLKPDEEGWSANDTLAHLRSCADFWGKSIREMISQDHPTLRYVSPRTWIRKKDYPDQEFEKNLGAFRVQRTELLAALTVLALGDWSRGATFTGTTRGREQTVMSYVIRMSQHEAEHCIQIEALVERLLDQMDGAP